MFKTDKAAGMILWALFLLFPWPTFAGSGVEDGINSLARQISESLKSSNVKKIAVIDFTDISGYQSVLGQFLAEELVTQLFLVSPGQFDVVERRQLAKVLGEQKLTASGLFDPETIASVGKILGIQALVTGSITDLEESEVRVNARVIAVDSAKIFAAAATNLPKEGALARLIHQSAGRQGAGEYPAGLPAGASARQAQASDVFFQNNFLRIDVKSIGRSADKRQVTLALSFENISREDLLLAMVNGSLSWCAGSIVSESGSEARLRRKSLSGLTCLYSDDAEEVKNYVVFNPGAKTAVVMVFEAYEEIVGKFFALSAELFRYADGRPSRFTAGLSNIELPE